MRTDKMAVGKSIKMYLTIFIATTCIYMVLYQYHISRDPMPVNEIIKTRQKSSLASTLYSSTSPTAISASSSASVSSSSLSSSSYASFLWSPLSILRAAGAREQTADNNVENKEKQKYNNNKNNELKDTFKSSTSSASSSSILLSINSTISSTPSLAITTTRTTTLTGVSGLTTTTTTTKKKLNNLTIPTTTATTPTNLKDLTKSKIVTRAIINGKDINSVGDSGSSTANISSSSSSSSSMKSSTSLLSSTITNPNNNNKNNNNNNKNKFHNAFVAVSEPPPLYIITPTYRRSEQLAELTRLGYTLKHVVNLLWLVIEDANKTSDLVTQTLNRIGVPYEYFVAPMPEEYKKTKKAKPRGVSNRNRGLSYLRANATEGVFYFADDDNTYDISIFEQMRYTKKVSMWPVGLVTKYGVSSPIVRKGKIDGFYDGWIGGRKFPVDMAGFAVSVKFLHERPAAKMPFKPGYEEDGFLRSLSPLNLTEIELLASDCTEVLTWHTQTKKNGPAQALNITKYGDTNLAFIDKVLVRP